MEIQSLALAENNQGGRTVVDVGRQVSNLGSGNTYKIGASATSLNNGSGSKTVRLGQGLDSQGNNNVYVIGL